MLPNTLRENVKVCKSFFTSAQHFKGECKGLLKFFLLLPNTLREIVKVGKSFLFLPIIPGHSLTLKKSMLPETTIETLVNMRGG